MLLGISVVRGVARNGGKLTLEVANAYLDDDYAAGNPDVNPGLYVMVAVTDTGVGMSREIMQRAFDPFFTTKPEGQGTGLGLSQVFGFIKQSGGHVKLYSEVGQGTTVKLYVQKAFGDNARALHEPADEQAPNGTGETVLVDPARFRRMMTASLRATATMARRMPSRFASPTCAQRPTASNRSAPLASSTRGAIRRGAVRIASSWGLLLRMIRQSGVRRRFFA